MGKVIALFGGKAAAPRLTSRERGRLVGEGAGALHQMSDARLQREVRRLKSAEEEWQALFERFDRELRQGGL